MKKSYYNFLFPGEDDKTILYNSRTGAMAELDAEHTEQLKNWTESELEEKSPEFASALYENGFAVADGVSELDMIRYDMFRAKFSGSTFYVVIAPTQNCNFKCKYCYEKNVIQSKYMDQETQNMVLKYIRESIVPDGELHVCWYGGEPLMAVDIIEKLTEGLLNICREKNVTYYADMISNGYLLSEKIAEKLIRCQISQIQITLDGGEEMHNRRRPLVNGGDTYNTIWNNILNMEKFKEEIKIILRVNVDKENDESLYEIKTKIEESGLREYIYMYPGKVLAVDGCHNSESCYNSREFAILEQKFASDCTQMLRCKYPTPKSIACCVDSIRTMIIDFQGDMYKCYMDIGNKKRCIGNINTDKFINEEVLYEYGLRDITQNEKCKKCKFLPICMGGCYQEAKRGQSCIAFKYNLDKYMKYIPKVMKLYNNSK